MHVTMSGYFTPSRWFEEGLRRWVEAWARKILGDSVKQVKITFMKRSADWDVGFHWLYRYGAVELVVPYGYRSYWRARWLTLHELHHAKQQIEGRLNKSLELVKFKGRNGVTGTYRYARGDYESQAKNGLIYVDLPPWEIEVHRDVVKRARGLSKKAWRVYRKLVPDGANLN